MPKRTAFISGASKGIGLACAKELAKADFDVAICARDAERLSEAAKEIQQELGVQVHVVPGDLSTAAGVDKAVAHAIAELGQVDVLVNVAGSAPPGTVQQLTDEQWDLAIDLKLRGYLRLIRAFLPDMVDRGWGRIINVAGNAGKQPDGWLVTSAVVNGALMSLTKAIATSVAANGVTCNAVCPGPTETDRWTGMQNAYSSMFDVAADNARGKILEAIPSGRIATPEDVAYGVAFFAHESASQITGQSLMIDGGQVKSV